ncbi:unnamed protein product [Staurois parvus]|uniref:RNA-binding protein 38 n=1 Tax=Staurois parvus TaxID=386267 RepID=A0ABN9FLG2_9NEOB|nr:unnamed protein product [Staurois parvus]
MGGRPTLTSPTWEPNHATPEWFSRSAFNNYTTAFIQRPIGLTPQYIYPPALIQPSVVIPTPLQSLPSPYIEYNAATQGYTHYTTAAYEQYPYAASPAAGYVGYGYTGAVQQPMSATATGAPPTAFIQYQPTQLQPDRMQ